MTYDDHRTRGSGEQRDGVGDGLFRWCDRGVGEPADRSANPRVARRQHLHLVGKHEVRDAALHERVLAREAHQLTVVGVALHGLCEQGDVGERGGEVEILERAPAAHLRRHLTRDRKHGRAVDLGVVETSEQVGRAGPGDGEARRQLPGELPVGRRGERGCAFVPDPYEGEVTASFGHTHRVGKTEVGVADHPEHMGHAPGAHRLDHHIRDRPDGGCSGGNAT